MRDSRPPVFPLRSTRELPALRLSRIRLEECSGRQPRERSSDEDVLSSTELGRSSRHLGWLVVVDASPGDVGRRGSQSTQDGTASSIGRCEGGRGARRVVGSHASRSRKSASANKLFRMRQSEQFGKSVLAFCLLHTQSTYLCSTAGSSSRSLSRLSSRLSSRSLSSRSSSSGPGISSLSGRPSLSRSSVPLRKKSTDTSVPTSRAQSVKMVSTGSHWLRQFPGTSSQSKSARPKRMRAKSGRTASAERMLFV
ncbi:hypothetical protein IWX48DRAFT_4302 [Phyllosticta citricarpa]